MPVIPRPSSVFAALALLLLAPCAFAHNIAVFGDSLADGVWSGLHQEVKGHAEDKLFRDSKVGTGLTKPDFNDFLTDFTKTLDRDQISDIVVMFGANDQESLRDENHKGFLFQSNGWIKVYRARIQSIIDTAAKHHAKLVWIGLPILRDEDLNKGALFINGIIEDEVKKDGATFISIENDFKDSDGSFASHLADKTGEMREVRIGDGTHFTFYGYDLIAKKVYGQVRPAETPTPAPAAPASPASGSKPQPVSAPAAEAVPPVQSKP